MGTPSKYFSDLGYKIILIAAGIIAYSNTIDASFQYDDYAQIVLNKNIHMKEFSWGRLMGSGFPEYPLDRIIARISFSINYYFGGLNVSGYHYVNIFIHIVTALGVFSLVKALVQNIGDENGETVNYSQLAFIASLLWLLSPVQTQAVTYIVQRMTSLAALFYVYSLTFYIKGRTSRGTKSALLLSSSIFFYLLALGTKQNVILLPLIVILYEYLQARRQHTRLLKDKNFIITLTAIAALSSALLYYNYEWLHIDTFFGFGYALKERIFTEARVLIYYIFLMLFPVSSKLALMHDFPVSSGIVSPLTTLTSLIAIAGIIIFSIWRIKKSPIISFFILFFFINILPESILVHIDPMNEHRLYLPGIGFYAVLSYIIVNIISALNKRQKILYNTLLISIMILFAVNTYARNMKWRNGYSLWSDNVKKAPMLSVPHEGLGMEALKIGKLGQAEAEFEKVRALDPLSPVASMGLSRVHYKRGDYALSLSELNYLVQRREMGFGLGNDQGVKDFMLELSQEFKGIGRIEEARTVLLMALRIYPENKYLREALRRLGRGNK